MRERGRKRLKTEEILEEGGVKQEAGSGECPEERG